MAFPRFTVNSSLAQIVSILLVLFLHPFLVLAVLTTQKKGETQPPTPLIKRTTTRHENRHFSYGGTITIVGAPEGSVTIEGWNRSEFDLTADIELNAASDEDFARLAAVNSFVFDEDANHLSVLTTGTHDKSFMRRSARNFPKTLLSLPWKIDYRIRVPSSSDLEVNAGRGAVKISGVEGAIRLSATQGETTFMLTGGVVSATVAAGTVRFIIPVQSWRGGGADIRLAAGDLSVELPPGFNGDIDADILRSGKIEDSYGSLAARERPGLTPLVMRARAGAGGAFFKFAVGVGNLYIKKAAEQ